MRLNEKLIASVGEDYLIKILDLDKGICFKTLHVHTMVDVGLLKVTENQVISGSSWGGLIKVWDITIEKCLYNMVDKGLTFLLKLNHSQVASATFIKQIKIWDFTSQNCKLKLKGHNREVIFLLKLNERQLASGSRDNTIKVWNFTTGNCLLTMK